MTVVLDASVAAMWFIPEAHSANALLLAEPGYELIAPDILPLEVASALLKASRRSRMDTATIHEALDTLPLMPVRTASSAPFARPAFDLARQEGGSLYDSVYVLLAKDIDAPIVTGDSRLAAVAQAAGVRAIMIQDPLPPA
jgi:predicted nucleic acid-binding protein